MPWKAFDELSSRYYAQGALWWATLEAQVGDESWLKLDAAEQQRLAALRVEHDYFAPKPNRLVPLKQRSDGNHFGQHTMTEEPIREKLLAVLNARKPMREAQMTSVRCEVAAGFDYCKRIGEKANGDWAATLVTERGLLMWERITKTTRLEEIEKDIEELVAQRGRVRVVTIDNVPPVEYPQDTKFVQALLKTFGAEWVCQDRFHVFHNISPEFNNQDPRYFPLVILNLRNLTTRRDGTKEEELDLLLRQGKVAKKVTFGHATFEVKLGQKMKQEEINHWKTIGVYHEMFSKAPYAVVPEYVKSKALLVDALDQWFNEIKEKCFDAQGAPIPDPIRNTKLIWNLKDFERIRDAGLLRMKSCVPPTAELESLAWFETGTVHNFMDVMRPRYHSCGNESWHSSQQDFIVGDHTSEAMATALYYEGITKQNSCTMRRLGEEDDRGHFDPERSLAVNRWAGHGEEAGGNPKLVADAPHPQLLARPHSTGETCVQQVAFTSARQRRQLVAVEDGPVELAGPTPHAGPMPQPKPDVVEMLRARRQGKQAAGSDADLEALLADTRRKREEQVANLQRMRMEAHQFYASAMDTGIRVDPAVAEAFGVDLPDHMRTNQQHDGGQRSRSASPVSESVCSSQADSPISAARLAARRERQASGKQASQQSSSSQSQPRSQPTPLTQPLSRPPGLDLSPAFFGAKRDSKRCKWMCMCTDPALTKQRGRKWCHSECMRGRWIQGDLRIAQPTPGSTVVILASAGTSAGDKYAFNGKQWSKL